MQCVYMNAKHAADPEAARYWMGEIFRRGSNLIAALVGEMGGWASLPDAFQVSGKAWNEAEDAICKAAYAGRWWETVGLGDEYLKRIEGFCNEWRKKMAKAKGAAK